MHACIATTGGSKSALIYLIYLVIQSQASCLPRENEILFQLRLLDSSTYRLLFFD
jgi:hypothetical protein